VGFAGVVARYVIPGPGERVPAALVLPPVLALVLASAVMIRFAEPADVQPQWLANLLGTTLILAPG
jgi:hypothetical protein